ncbi:MAG: lactate racemase domain-containing protein [Syntrophales bacterium]|nr:lactate racemase domain-containing protein [Syntrophales bacterium]
MTTGSVYPRMFRVRQVFDVPKIEDIEDTLRLQLASIHAESFIKPGARIAITAGSRGIAHIDIILRYLVRFLRDHGAEPFLVTAMGSHGGGKVPGQLQVLKSLKITEETMGVPILATMDSIEIGRSANGHPVLVDRYAAAADAVVIVNRVKPHTAFEGPIQSGLMKMMAIGLGNHIGCSEVHRQAVNYGYRDIIPEIGQIILNRLPVIFGIGIVENTYDETAIIKALLPSQFMEGEKVLLARAKQLMAQLPFDKIDLLIVDRMGKNISGSGMDTNVIGRIMFIGEKEPEERKITRIIACDLTEETHGNAMGIGLADFTTRRLVSKIDMAATITNAITAMVPEKARIPIVMGTDREAVAAALKTIGAVEPAEARIVRIKNTLEIADLDISEALYREIGGRKDLNVIRDLGGLVFDGDGNLASFAAS